MFVFLLQVIQRELYLLIDPDFEIAELAINFRKFGVQTRTLIIFGFPLDFLKHARNTADLELELGQSVVETLLLALLLLDDLGVELVVHSADNG